MAQRTKNIKVGMGPDFLMRQGHVVIYHQITLMHFQMSDASLKLLETVTRSDPSLVAAINEVRQRLISITNDDRSTFIPVQKKSNLIIYMPEDRLVILSYRLNEALNSDQAKYLTNQFQCFLTAFFDVRQ